eukprot:CAMPEP_0170736810 /NCGR_PEP_ID=MMETSP0437-20130122/3804_1 /TAXON_ID=0 /ORGANISM="Sexangularia sp." /LENGTH=1056 /DNA_ID=CAMNT_0011075179 /DNA_START=24 /DNA_END=3190 /DNA_ORIENTATION=+
MPTPSPSSLSLSLSLSSAGLNVFRACLVSFEREKERQRQAQQAEQEATFVRVQVSERESEMESGSESERESRRGGERLTHHSSLNWSASAFTAIRSILQEIDKEGEQKRMSELEKRMEQERANEKERNAGRTRSKGRSDDGDAVQQQQSRVGQARSGSAVHRPLDLTHTLSTSSQFPLLSPPPSSLSSSVLTPEQANRRLSLSLPLSSLVTLPSPSPAHHTSLSPPQHAGFSLSRTPRQQQSKSPLNIAPGQQEKGKEKEREREGAAERKGSHGLPLPPPPSSSHRTRRKTSAGERATADRLPHNGNTAIVHRRSKSGGLPPPPLSPTLSPRSAPILGPPPTSPGRPNRSQRREKERDKTKERDRARAATTDSTGIFRLQSLMDRMDSEGEKDAPAEATTESASVTTTATAATARATATTAATTTTTTTVPPKVAVTKATTSGAPTSEGALAAAAASKGRRRTLPAKVERVQPSTPPSSSLSLPVAPHAMRTPVALSFSPPTPLAVPDFAEKKDAEKEKEEGVERQTDANEDVQQELQSALDHHGTRGHDSGEAQGSAATTSSDAETPPTVTPSPEVTPSSPTTSAPYVALWSFTGDSSDDLSLKKGERVQVSQIEGEWAYGERVGSRGGGVGVDEGWFPTAYARPIDDPEAKQCLADLAERERERERAADRDRRGSQVRRRLSSKSLSDALTLAGTPQPARHRGPAGLSLSPTLEHAVTLVTARWRGIVTRRHYRRALHRARLAGEVYSSEVSYLDALVRADDAFAGPLRRSVAAGGKKVLLSEAEIEIIFGLFPRLRQLSVDFVAGLRPRVTRWTVDSCVGDVFLSHVSSPTFASLYTAFTTAYYTALDVIARAKARSKAFARWLATAEDAFGNRSAVGNSLQSFLIMPIQRLARYVLLLRELSAVTPPSHPDAPTLARALPLMVKTVEAVNEAERARDAEHGRLQRCRELTSRLVNEVAELTNDPTLDVLSIGSCEQLNVEQGRMKPRTFAVLSSCIILAKPQPRNKLLVRYVVRGARVATVRRIDEQSRLAFGTLAPALPNSLELRTVDSGV